MKIKEADAIATMLGSMLQTKGIVGFKIARNYRMIQEELKEYTDKKRELFEKYGTEHEGNLIIDKGSENYPLFLEEMKPYNDQEVEFNFRLISEEELIDSGLTAEQMIILSNYNMLEE